MIGEIKNLERRFALMAERGWMIDKIGFFIHRYRAVEPCKKRFFVDLLPQITAFDYPHNEDAQDYRRLREESGWTFAASNKQIHVFCADGDAPPPVSIHTDNKIQAQVFLKISRKYELPWVIFFALYLVWQIFFIVPAQGIEVFFSNLGTFLIIGYLFFAPVFIWLVWSVLSWYARTKKAYRLGLPMPAANYRMSRIRERALMAASAVFFVCVLAGAVLDVSDRKASALPLLLLVVVTPAAIVGIALWARRRIDTRRRERKANRRLMIAAIVAAEALLIGAALFAGSKANGARRVSDSLDNRPVLTLRDTLPIFKLSPGANDDIKNHTRVRSSLAVPVNYTYWEANRFGRVETRVYGSINEFTARKLYNRLIKMSMKRNKNLQTKIDRFGFDKAEAWGAFEGAAFSNPAANTHEMILLNGKTVLRVSTGGAANIKAEFVHKLW